MKTNLKRIFALLLALIAGLSLLACQPKKDRDAEASPTPGMIDLPTSRPTEVPTETPAPDGSEAPGPTEAPTPTAVPTATPAPTPTPAPTATPCPVDENGIYDTKDEVALYILIYGHLPSNYITKREAQELGWTGGSLEPYAPGKCIGGDRFGNYEGQLPTKRGRTYYECDIGTLGKSSRGAKRIVYSNDGLIYYTGDHYEHFTLLYGGDN